MITDILIYIVTFGLLLMLYRLLLAHTSYFALNRVVLILIPILAAAVPLAPVQEVEAVSSAVIVLPEVRAGVESGTSPVVQSELPWAWLLYLAGCGVFLVVFAVRLLRSLRYNETETGYAFLNRCLVNSELDPEVREVVLTHEMAHVKRGHTYEILYFELIKIVTWFNPLTFFLIRYAKENHEYEADHLSSKKHGNYAKILVAQHFQVDHKLLGHLFSMSNLKKRIQMMHRKKSPLSGLTRYSLFALLVLGLLATASWKAPDLVQGPGDKEEVVQDPDVQPEYPGGMNAMIEYLTNAIKYPEKARADGIEGTVFVSFTISKKGEVRDVQVKKGVNELLDNEALRVVKTFPNWKPGIKNEKPVATEMVLPIAFKLS